MHRKSNQENLPGRRSVRSLDRGWSHEHLGISKAAFLPDAQPGLAVGTQLMPPLVLPGIALGMLGRSADGWRSPLSFVTHACKGAPRVGPRFRSLFDSPATPSLMTLGFAGASREL